MVGGGLGALSSAARLAKTGHQVTLVERSDRLGGALGRLEFEGFIFDTGPTHTLLPAVIRDLFRKTGRPLERETDLVPLAVIREHRFADGTSLSLTGGSRATQKATFEELSPGLGEAWVRHVDPYSTTWERLRRDWFERPWNPDLAHPETKKLLASRTSLASHLARTLPDHRARLVATHPHTRDGQDPRRVPAWNGFVSYLEQNFGAWTIPGGIGVLGELMATRMATRKVTVLTDTPVIDLVVRSGRVAGVRTRDDVIEADAVVCAVDPTQFPAVSASLRPSRRHGLRRTRSTRLPDLIHLGLDEGNVLDDRYGTELPGEVVLHGAADIILRPGGSAPEGGRAVTLSSRDIAAENVLDILAERGLDLRPHVRVRLERPGQALARAWGGSPAGVLWDGRRTVTDRLGPRTPLAGLHVAGAYASAGAGLPFTGLSGWQVAQVIGPA